MKRPPNAYIIFRQEQYKIVTNKFPELTFIEISKELGKQWKQLSYDEKTIYYNLAQIKKTQFNDIKEKEEKEEKEEKIKNKK